MKSFVLSLALFVTVTSALPAANPAYEKFMRAYGEAEEGKGAAVLPTVDEALTEAEKGGATTLEALEIATTGAQIAFNFKDLKRAEDYTIRALTLLTKASAEKAIDPAKATDENLTQLSFLREIYMAGDQLDKARDAHTKAESALLAWAQLSGHPLWKVGQPAFVEKVPFTQVAGITQYLQADAQLYPDRAAADYELLEKFISTSEDFPGPAKEEKLKEIAEARAKLK